MRLNDEVSRHIPWLKIEHAVVLKLGISMGIVAAFFVPPPYSILVGITSNLMWMWKL
jgi:hypothetical protein